MEQIEKDLISVIIPVYNAEKELGRCIESILKQSYINLQILIIDDGSDCLLYTSESKMSGVCFSAGRTGGTPGNGKKYSEGQGYGRQCENSGIPERCEQAVSGNGFFCPSFLF